MATRSSTLKRWGMHIYRVIAAVLRSITRPSHKVVPKQRRRSQLLSGFLLLMTLNTLVGSMILKHAGGNVWMVMAATSAVFLLTYFISRSRYYRIALIIALVIPAVPPVSMAILKPPEINLTAELMWLSLPLLIASILLTIRQIIIVSSSYIACSVLLDALGLLDYKIMAPLMAYILIVTFIVTAIAAVRKADESEIENRLAKRLQAEKTIRESEEKFSKAFNASPQQIVITRARDNVTVDVNETFARLSGFTREQVIGQTADALGIWESPEENERFMRMLAEKDRISNEEFNFRNKAGVLTTALVSIESITIGGEECWISVMLDITERKRMETALRESEEKFSKAFAASPEIIAITTVKDGKYVDINDSYLLHTGYTREELIGHTTSSIDIWAHINDRNKMIEILREHGRIRNEEFDFRMKSGEIRTWIFSMEPITIGGEPCLIGVSLDITGRKRMEQALRDSEEKFSKAFQAIPESISISTMKDGIFLDANNSFLAHNGHTRKEVIGHTAEEINLWVDTSGRNRIQRLLQESGHFENEEFEFHVKSGDIHTNLLSAETIYLNGEPCILVVGNDITERKRMEQALRESEEKFSAAFHSSPNAILIASIEEDKFIDVNESFGRFVGYSREEIIGHNSKELKLFASEEDFQRMAKNLMEKGRIFNEEYRSLRKSGEERIGLFSAEAIFIAGKFCMIMAITDVTEQKLAEEKLKQALTDLEHSTAQLKATNKELESFSYSVSHDLRSPLRSIDGFSQALLEDYDARLDDTGKDYLRRLRGASQKMGELIDGLLKLSRLTRNEMHPEKVDLSALAVDISSQLQETQPEKHARFVIDPGLIANADPQMARVLL
ncbi:MAG: PAS domain S-box protein, partial [Dehalococcoidales bacterium]